MASEPSDDDFHDEVKTVTIRTFSSHDAANIARSNLEAHGIACWANADDCGGMYPNLTAPGGVRLSVRTSDAEAAIALLDAQASIAEISELEAKAVAALPEETPKVKLAPVQISLGIGLGIFLCLLCQQIEQSGTRYFYSHSSDGKTYEAFTYENGHLVETVRDRNFDGKWDAWIYYRNGHVVRAEYDNNFDEKPDEWVEYSNASPVTAEKDDDFNGIPDEFVTYTNGVIQQMDVRPNGSSFATQRWIYQNGILVEILRGGDSNGNFKEKVRYDPFFNPIPINFNPIRTNAPTAFQLLSPASK
jgi:hypothetical protein